jgi:hypothetical protein
MKIIPENVPLHLTRVDSALGQLLIAVQSVAETEDRKKVLVRLVLEQSREDGEQITMRELGLIASAAELFEPEITSEIVDRIRDWLESTEGDGMLDLTVS